MQTIALRLLGCCAVTYVAWSALGPQGIAWCAPLFGIALARPLFDGIANTLAWLRALAYRDVEGQHYAFKGISISAVADDEGHMWLRLSHVRKVLPWLSRDESLRQILGARMGQVLPDRATRVEAEAFLAYLGRRTSPDAVSFMQWIERTVVYPSRRRKAHSEGLASRPVASTVALHRSGDPRAKRSPPQSECAGENQGNDK
jgi:hypothetical protein